MGCSAPKPAVTRDEVEAIVQRSQDSISKDQAVRDAKAREQALKADKDILEKSLKADKEALERTLKESKELHAQTLADLKEAREPKAAHEELLKAHEELLKAHEHLDDKHLHKVQEIERFNQELKDHVDKMEVSVGNQIKVLKEELSKPPEPRTVIPYHHTRAIEVIPLAVPDPPQPLEEPPDSSTRDVPEPVQRGPQSPRPRKNFALSTDPGSDGVDKLWARRWVPAQPPRHPEREQVEPSRPGKEVERPKMDQDDYLEVQSLHGGEEAEEKNPPTAGKEWREVPADTVQHEQELPRETTGVPRPPEPVTVSPPTAAALEQMSTVQNLLGAHAEKISAGGLDSTRPTTAATRPPTAHQPEAKGQQLPEPGMVEAGKGQVKSMRKEDVIEIGVKLHKIMRESARAG